MKIIKTDLDPRIVISLDKSIKSDKIAGIMKFGEKNDYPDTIENLVQASPTGKACSDIFSKFIAGSSFVNPEIGKIVVGIDTKGKKITLDKIRRQLAYNLAVFRGAYLHLNFDVEMLITKASCIPFKQIRLSKVDDLGYCPYAVYSQNWLAPKKSIVPINLFSGNKDAFIKQVEQSGGIEKYNGQIYLSYIDESYLYPLSTFDSVYLDLDTEYQIQLFKNREIRNGFNKKIIMNMPFEAMEGEEETEFEQRQKEYANYVNDFMGPEGAKVLMANSEFDETGQIIDRSFKIEQIESNIDKDLFQNSWTKDTANTIRKATHALPAVLIDYEDGKLSGTSGEAITQAFNYYNSVTSGFREHLQEIIKEVFINFDNEVLRNNTEWGINKVTI